MLGGSEYVTCWGAESFAVAMRTEGTGNQVHEQGKQNHNEHKAEKQKKKSAQSSSTNLITPEQEQRSSPTATHTPRAVDGGQKRTLDCYHGTYDTMAERV